MLTSPVSAPCPAPPPFNSLEVIHSLKNIASGNLVSPCKLLQFLLESVLLVILEEERLSLPRLGGAGRVACWWRGWGLKCAPLGGPAVMAAAESYESASWTLVCYYSVHHGDQMAPGEMEPLASES